MQFEAYCVKCRTRRTVEDGEVKTTANGRQMAQGKCPVCGTTVTRFLAREGAGAQEAGQSGGASAKSGGKASGKAKSKAG